MGGTGLLSLLAGISSGNIELKFPIGALGITVGAFAVTRLGLALAAGDEATVVAAIAEALAAEPVQVVPPVVIAGDVEPGIERTRVSSSDDDDEARSSARRAQR
jgi:hypothetical protein